MSLSDILVPNSHDLYGKTLTTSSLVKNSSSFSTKLLADVASPPSTYTVLFQKVLIANSAYDINTGIYTVPVTGNYNFNAGISIQINNGATGATGPSGGQGTVIAQLISNGILMQSVKNDVYINAGEYYTNVISLNYFDTFTAGDPVKIVIYTVALPPTATLTLTAYGSWFFAN